MVLERPPRRRLQVAARDLAIICRNTTEAINHLAHRLRLRRSDIVVATVVEHHANLLYLADPRTGDYWPENLPRPDAPVARPAAVDPDGQSGGTRS